MATTQMPEQPDAGTPVAGDSSDLHQFGYEQKLDRTIGLFTSFCVSFSMVSITTAIFTLFSSAFLDIGGVGIWLWVPATVGGLVIAGVYGHLAARVPVTGYAYQWSSRLLSPHVGWFTGWFALCAFFVGTASIAVALGSVFAPEFFSHPTHGDVVLIGAIAVGVAVVITGAGVRRATFVNNIGATMEIFGTLVIAAIIGIGLFFFKHEAGPSILFNSKPVGGGPVNLTTVGLALLLPVTTLLGWEGAADLAEETKDPRKTAPKAMVRSVALSGIAGGVVVAIFAMAIPHGTAAMVNQSDNPLFYLFKIQLGNVIDTISKVMVFVAMFACLLANLTVATRMSYSLARDRLLPGHRFLAKVNDTTKIPMYSLLFVGAVAFGLQFLSAGIATNIFAITAVMYYGTYLLTMVVAWLAKQRGTLGEAPPGHFDLGKWLTPMTAVGVIWCLIVIGYMTIPSVNHIAAEYAAGAIVLGVLQWVFILRGRIASGEAGPPRSSVEQLRAAEYAARAAVDG